ncbi:MAG: hypothetical protein KatS3mg110_3026 [Pirellulaceae bacterium]|nr:MAG: hypothetical protein KatS3mg110_3026 [Pirellulaceae bacterium]
MSIEIAPYYDPRLVYQKQPQVPATASKNDDLRQAFNDFVGQTLFGQLLAAMRKTVPESAYFHGGRTEQVFRAQLDQVLAEKMAEKSADRLAGPMFELFMLKRP